MSRDTAQDRAHHEDPVIRVLAAALDEGESTRGPGRRRWVWTTERRGPAWWRRSLRWTRRRHSRRQRRQRRQRRRAAASPPEA
ncbi:hypothetical protein ACIRN4_18245 [Pimelobacter simplex]|uniref:hypothetical protein n=1 Tax=Nocardioides simplex TaxID=2045 RepID=UPI00382FCAB1